MAQVLYSVESIVYSEFHKIFEVSAVPLTFNLSLYEKASFQDLVIKNCSSIDMEMLVKTAKTSAC